MIPGTALLVGLLAAGATAQVTGDDTTGGGDRLAGSRITDPVVAQDALDAGSETREPAAVRTLDATPTAGPQDEAEPTVLAIPAIDAELPVVPVGVAGDGQMNLPEGPGTAGWYRHGPDPSGGSGATVLAAHVDTEEGPGPLSRLAEVEAGDRVRLTIDGAPVEYVVDRVDRYAKTALDTDALFDRGGPARLHLVTCGGAWDEAAGAYEDNVVAVARRI